MGTNERRNRNRRRGWLEMMAGKFLDLILEIWDLRQENEEKSFVKVLGGSDFMKDLS